MHNKSTKQWERYFDDLGIRKDISGKYLKYIQRLNDSGFPVIFEFSHLAKLLGRNEEYLASVINATNYHYRIYSIPKRSGGLRKISAPYPALLECQRWINENILSKIHVHEAAHGFITGKSIKSNAEKHLGSNNLLKLDLKDFFPSIKKNQIIQIFKECGYPNNISFYLASICCLDNCLPQGAATSPALSNIITYGLDSRLSGLSLKYGLIYSRYADDLTFSGDKISIKTKEIILKIIIEQGFVINKEKIHLCRSKGKRIVTGLSVAGQKLMVPREYKRKLRQDVHYIIKYSHVSQAKYRGIKNPFFLDSIYGKLVFWNNIEPNNIFVKESMENIRKLNTIKSKTEL